MMARPRIGIFGALFAVGGVLAWRWVQRQRAAQAPLARDLTRWEGEGGNVTEFEPPVGGARTAQAAHHSRNGVGNGADHGATGDAWPFPRS
jgi:hypothetical protein